MDKLRRIASRSTKAYRASGTSGSCPVPDQGQSGDIIVDGGLAHELLHAIDHGGAQFLGSFVVGLLQPRFYAFQSEFLAPALTFEQTFAKPAEEPRRGQRDQGRLASRVRKESQG